MNQHQLKTTMKKSIITSAIALIITGSAFAQPVSDRAVVPMGITLQQILRISVVDGGNVEFVFNTIDDYKLGISISVFYDTRFKVASSTNWELHLGAEDGTFIGTDDPTRTLTLDNVGFMEVTNGNYSIGGELSLAGGGYTTSDVTPNRLKQYFGAGSALDQLYKPFGGAGGNNGGDIADNDFTLHWECGTTNGTMNATAIIDQVPSVAADRYVTNVFLDLEAL